VKEAALWGDQRPATKHRSPLLTNLNYQS